MTVRYTDAQIDALIKEPKRLPEDLLADLGLKEKPGHKEREIDVTGDAGHSFRIIIRQSSQNSLDFSVILGLLPEGGQALFRLRRYNGKSHEHTNTLEGTTFYDFHVHTATQRYQELGSREDTFAAPSAEYSEVRGALQCLVSDCGVILPERAQRSLF